MDKEIGILGEDKELILQDLLDVRNTLHSVAERFAYIAADSESKDEACGLAVIAGGLALLVDGINIIGEEIESDGRL